MAYDHGMMLMSDHDDAYVDAMLVVNMQANTRSVTKLMAIFSEEEERLKTWKIGGGGPCWSSWSSQAMPPPGRWIWGCRMTRWRKSTREGSIYRTKWARANLTYLFAASVKYEGVQVDTVTVRTIIKGLCR